MIRVALSSHDSALPSLLAPALGRDFVVFAESNRARLKDLFIAGSLDVLLLDLDSNLSNAGEQIEFCHEMTQSGVGVLALTDEIAMPVAVSLVERGALGYCRKPPAARQLKALVRSASEFTAVKRQLEAKNARSAVEPNSFQALKCGGLVGSSREMRAVYDLIRRVANLNASILITGESGTGKELIARAIHNLGSRARFPFIAVSCGAIPETLIESELFGHERGAFTGTTGTRTGYFEQAADGTLFIDEIGELSLHTQVKLLRVLQEREFTRLGSGRAIPLRARVLFSTHRDLRRMIAEGTFRLDLYYRINVMTIKAPALCDRVTDIPLLAEYFVKHYSEIYGKKVSGVAPSALALLQEYDWPGNVRELENVIQSAIICSDTETIEAKDLGERFNQTDALEQPDLSAIGTFEKLVRDFKIRVATKAIEEFNGNKTLAARSLDISRAYLHRLIRSSEGAGAADVA
jgi:DNA-binding NtrC family response regulator